MNGTSIELIAFFNQNVYAEVMLTRNQKTSIAILCLGLFVYFGLNIRELSEGEVRNRKNSAENPSVTKSDDSPIANTSEASEATTNIENENFQTSTLRSDAIQESSAPNSAQEIVVNNANRIETETAKIKASPVSPEPYAKVLRGLKLGHFDIETSSQVYPAEQGEVDHHTHEYDDEFDVTFVDYFNLLDRKLNNINKIVPPDVPFVLIVGNTQLSKGGFIKINDESIPVTDYQKRVGKFIAGDRKSISIFSLNGTTGQKLKTLKIGFLQDTLETGGLHETTPSCVMRNVPGKHGEYRNGALIIQAIAIDQFKIDPGTKTAALDAGMLWESTIFWHNAGRCYR